MERAAAPALWHSWINLLVTISIQVAHLLVSKFK